MKRSAPGLRRAAASALLTVADQGEEYPLLTTVRMRNLPSAEELW